MNLADNLKRIRKENNLSQEQLAEKLNVTRQAVSKWESGISYPEMDKVMQICQLFNLNINELVHEDLSKITEKKKEKDNLSKVIDSFFNYITKVVNLFSSLKFKDVIKCLFEQVVIIIILLICFSFIGMFLGNIFIWIVPYNSSLYHIIYFLEGIYVLGAFILSLAILLHVFKIRYLDYYEIVTKDEVINNDEEEKHQEVVKEGKKVIEQKREKIIVRDPKHSEYSFIKFLFKGVLLLLKGLALFALSIGACIFIFILICFILSFLVIKTGLFFVALEIGFIGAGLLTYLIILILFDFIFNRDLSKKFLLISFISALIFIGSGIGLGAVSLVQFDIKDNNEYVTTQFNQPMKSDMIISDYRDYYRHRTPIEYIASDNTDVKIVVEHSRYMDANLYLTSDRALLEVYDKKDLTMDLVRQIIDDINNKKIISYSNNFKIKVYTTEENIKILKDNADTYYDLIQEYQTTIENLYEQKSEDETKIVDLEQQVETLKEYLNNTNYQVSYDENGNLVIINNNK